MKLSTGTGVGPYEIVGWLGAGGMGEVYRARDPRLGRDVAIKLIAEAFATDANRLKRFEDEARAAGQLNHPNILSVYDVGIHAGAPYIVSELLEGESLARRLQGGKLPARKAIDYACQTAEGLAAAHDKGIVHRDIKPDNLFIANDGRLKILDFGIAKLTQPSDDDTPQSRVRTETADGMVVGTQGYMSPEQVRGEPVDARSDIFSLGAVLYEMLTGRAAFARGTGAETVAAILKEEPPEPLSESSLALERIVARCLEKVRDVRFQSAQDLAFGLRMLSGTTATAAPASAQTANRRVWLRGRALPWVVAGALGLALVLVAWAPWRRTLTSPPVRLSVALGTNISLSSPASQIGGAAVLSPDGAIAAFVAQKVDGSRSELYVRRLNAVQAAPLSGTDGAVAPFFSPDGMWIGFFAGGKLKKVAVTGGAPVTLADAPNSRGGTWSEDGTIVFSPSQLSGTRLLRVSSDGGQAEPLLPLAEGEVVQLWPQILPGGKAVLYTSSTVFGSYNNATLVVQPLPSGTRKVVQTGGHYGRYLHSGHIAFIHDGTLFAAPFNLDRLEVIGQPVPALEGVTSNSISGGAQFAASSNGTLVYLPGQSTGAGSALHWMDREGKETPLRSAPANWFSPLFSPDGGRLAMEIRDGPSDIWVYEWKRDMLTRVTSDPTQDAKPVWSPAGGRIAFASARADKSTLNLYLQRADGAGEAQRLTESRNAQRPASWHPSGKFLAFEETTAPSNVDLMILPMDGDDASGWTPGKPTVFVNSSSVEIEPMFSSDGRWLAYSSIESGRLEVFVRPFPGPGPTWKISTNGGMLPTWSRTRQELFYGANGQIMVAPFAVKGDSLVAEKPRLWSERRYLTRGSIRLFDLHPDGERFAMAPVAHASESAHQDHLTFVFNFFDELRRIAPFPNGPTSSSR